MLSNKIRQSRDIKGITIFGNEIKISQFADDTNFFCDNVTSAEKSLKTVNDFTDISGLRLNTKKTKAIWLGKWSANKSTPLNVKWLRCPVKVLGVYISYDEKKNDEHNFMLKLRKLQTKLDMWKARDSTLFGSVMFIKSLGLAQLIYSIFNLNEPDEIIPNVKKRLFNFIWKNKRDKIKRESLYQDLTAGGIRMVNFDVIIKALRLAWIPRLLSTETLNWKTIPDRLFKKCGGLNLLLRCNYDPKRLPQMPTFYKDILTFFNDLKGLYSGDGFQELILFNNKDILIDGNLFIMMNG